MGSATALNRTGGKRRLIHSLSGLVGDALVLNDINDTTANTFHIRDGEMGGGAFGAAVTPGGLFGAGGILQYDGSLEYILVVGPVGAGLHNTYHVDDNDASSRLQINDGQGNATFDIQADQLAASADHLFNGGAGNDTFRIHLAAGAVATGKSISVFGGGPAADRNNRDVVDVLVDQGSQARTTTFTYPTLGQVNAQVDSGTLLELAAVETVTYVGDAADNDQLRVVGTPADDRLTVAPLSADSAIVFNGTAAAGAGWQGPPASYWDTLPGLAGGSAGPDLVLSGIAGTGIRFEGGGRTNGDTLTVYARSENALSDPATTIDPFGFGARLLVPGFGVGNAYDRITVDDTQVLIAGLLPVTLDATSFEQTNTLNAGLVVNAGFEASPDVTGIADSIVAIASNHFKIQVNGGDPIPAMAPRGDRLEVFTPGEINVYADKSNPPNISITSTDRTTGQATFAVGWSSIERVTLTASPDSQTVNLIGDNNDLAGPNQNDSYVLVGRDVDSGLPTLESLFPATTIHPDYEPDADGANEFSLSINGSAWIDFRNVRFVNALGDQDDDPATLDSDGVDRLEVTPYADDTPKGWGIDVQFDEGDPDADAQLADMVVYHAVPGVSEEIIVQPSAPGCGQIIVRNAADGSVITTLDYTTNTGLEIVGNDGSAGDTDTLILRGTDGVTQSGTSGRDTAMVDLTATGQVGDPLVSVTDEASGEVLYELFTITGSLTFDSLRLELDGAADEIELTVPQDARLTPGSVAGSGVVDQMGDASVYFDGAELLVVNSAVAGSRLSFLATDGNDSISVGSIGATLGTVSFGGLQVVFNDANANITNLIVDALLGDDTIEVTPIEGVRVDVDGGAPSASDKLILHGIAGVQERFRVSPTTHGNGTIDDSAVLNAVDVAYTGIEQLVLVHQMIDGDGTDIAGTAGDDRFEFYHGLTADAATVVAALDVTSAVGGGFALPTIGLLGLNPLGPGVGFNSLGGGGNDSVVVHGTASDDVFDVRSGVVINSVAGQRVAFVRLGSSSQVIVEGEDGDDRFTVEPNPALSVTIQGGDPSASDQLDFLGSGAGDILVDLVAMTITENAMAPVSFSGVERVNVDAAGTNVTVRGTTGDDSFRYRPVGAEAGELVLAGLNSLFAIANVGALSVDGLAGSDALTVDATDNADTVDITGTSVAVNDGAVRQSIEFARFEALAVNGLTGDDTFNVTPGALPISIDGGLPTTNGSTPAPADVITITTLTVGTTRLIPGATPDAGTVVTPDGRVLFAHAERLHLVGTVLGPDTLQAEATGANDELALAASQGANVLTINNHTVVTFAQFETVDLFGLGGDDLFDVWPAGLSGVTGINVHGGEPTASDRLIVNGTAGADAIMFTPTTANAGTVSILGIAAVSFDTTEAVTLHGQGGDDDLTVFAPIAEDMVTYTPGAAVDAGDVRVGSLVPMRFEALGAGGRLWVYDLGGVGGTLVYEGTAGSDQFAVQDEVVFLTTEDSNDHVAVIYSGFESLVLDGQGGTDNATLVGSGSADVIAVGLAPRGDVVTGVGPASITLLTVERLVVNASTGNDSLSLLGFGSETDLETVTLNTGGDSGDTIRVTGSGKQETITVTPESAASVTATTTSSATVLNAILGTAASSTFTVDLSGSAALVVNASDQTDDPIAVSGSAVAIPGRKTVDYTSGQFLTVHGLAGADRFVVTPSPTVEIFIDGDTPTGVTPGDTLSLNAAGSSVALEAGPEADEGAYVVEGQKRVSFDHIESLSVINAGSMLVLGTNGDDDITLIARDASTHTGADGVRDLTVSVNSGPEVLLLNVSQVYVDALAGDDDIIIRTPAPNRADWNVTLYVAGGTPSDSDRLVLETPGDTSVDYQPAGYVPPAVFAHSDADTGKFTVYDHTGQAPSSVINIGPFVMAGFQGGWMSSTGGVEHLLYDGENGQDNLFITLDPQQTDRVRYTYDPESGVGLVEVGSNNSPRLPLEFQNLSSPQGQLGQVTIRDAGQPYDEVVYAGTAAQDQIEVTGGTITNSRFGYPSMPLNTLGIERLRLDGLDGDDLFTVHSNHTFVGSLTVAGGDPSASDVLTLVGDAGSQAITVQYNGDGFYHDIILGIGGSITVEGVERVVIDGRGGSDTLGVVGTADDDRITYTPTAVDAGTFVREDANTVYEFRAIAGSFSISGNGGSADELVVMGTNSHDVITIDARLAHRTVSVENVSGNVLKPVALATDLEVVSVLGRLGADTFLVIPDSHVGQLAAGQLPYNLLVHVDGGTGSASDALVVAGNEWGAELGANDFVVINRSRTADEGVVRVFRNAQPLPDISFVGVEVVSPVPSTNNVGDPNVLVMGPDQYEQNEYRTTAAYLGSGDVINVTDLAVFPGWGEHRFVVADEDYFRVVAKTTGIMDFQVYFHGYGALLPGGGDLDIRVLDADGTVIAGYGPLFGTNETSPWDSDERIRIPVVAGQTYYLHVSGLGGASSMVTNGYDITIVNTAPPVPYDLELQDTPVGDNSDSGRSEFDNVTFDNTPTIVFRLDDGTLLNDLPGNGATNTPPDQIVGIPFAGTAPSPGYRIAIFDEGSTPGQSGTAPQTPLGFAVATAEPGVYTFTVPKALSDGSHFLTARVQMIDPAEPTELGFGERSVALEIIVDTQQPAPVFGDSSLDTDGLRAESDTGITDQVATIVDRITRDSTPTFWGTAEANTVVRLYADRNGNHVLDLGTDLYLGQTVATPLDGTNQFANGQWEFTTPIDFNHMSYFGLDGLRTVFVTAEDVAGNVTPPENADALSLFLDTRGPRIVSVNYTANGMSVLDPKPYVGPTPLANSIDITFLDEPGRTAEFDYAAVNRLLATNVGNYQLIGDANGVILLDHAEIVADYNTNIDGLNKRLTTVRLFFVESLPDDRLTLTVFDRIMDDPGNALDGDVKATGPGTDIYVLPTGDGVPGQSFAARFTVDSRPELGVWGAGSVWVDTNGNFIFDSQNTDQTNRDITYKFAITSDDVFAGNFTRYAAGAADGFDKLAAYGRLSNQYRWLIDTDNDGVADVNQIDPAAINGVPFAGRFDGNWLNGDEVGLIVSSPTGGGSTWYFDTDHDYQINRESRLVSQLQGFPVVGDFNGDGWDDLGTWQNDVFQIDLAWPTGSGTLPWDGVADAVFHFGFIGVRERPVAADMNQDGFEDLGLWVPDLSGSTPSDSCDWYFLLSGSLVEGGPIVSILDRPDVQSGSAEFKPVPFGNDLSAQLGDQFAAPLVGNFDPPVAGGTKILRLEGTSRDDLFEFVGGPKSSSWIVKLNGVATAVADGFTAVEFVGLGGNDTVRLTGTEGNDYVELWSDHGTFSGTGYRVTVAGVETITVDGRTGSDTALLHDSAGDDRLVASPTKASLTSSGSARAVSGFEKVTVEATAGGADVASLTDSAGDDTFEASPDLAKLFGEGFSLELRAFDSVSAYASTGNDVARLYDSLGDDAFFANKKEATLRGKGFLLRAQRFDSVYGYSTAGGNDVARLEGTTADDTFVATPTLAELNGAGLLLSASQFETVTAVGGGGTNVAYLHDSAGNDVFAAKPRETSLSGQGFQNTVVGFGKVYGYADMGGVDVASLYDAASDDRFTSDPAVSTLQGKGFFLQAEMFDYVHGFATGGRDVATLHGSSGNDTLIAERGETRLSGASFNCRAKAFDEVYAYGGEGTADKSDVRDTEIQTVTAAQAAPLASFEQILWAYDFESVRAKKKSTEAAAMVLGTVDEVFRAYWD